MKSETCKEIIKQAAVTLTVNDPDDIDDYYPPTPPPKYLHIYPGQVEDVAGETWEENYARDNFSRGYIDRASGWRTAHPLRSAAQRAAGVAGVAGLLSLPVGVLATPIVADEFGSRGLKRLGLGLAGIGLGTLGAAYAHKNLVPKDIRQAYDAAAKQYSAAVDKEVNPKITSDKFKADALLGAYNNALRGRHFDAQDMVELLKKHKVPAQLDLNYDIPQYN